MKPNEQEPKHTSNLDEEREHFTLDEETERISPITEVDPYLAQKRQQEQENYEKEFEKNRQTRQEKEKDRIERLALQAKDELEKDSTLGSTKEALPAPSTSKEAYRQREVLKKKWFNPNAIVGWATGLLGLFGAKESAATELGDSTDKKAAKIEAVRSTGEDSLRNKNERTQISQIEERKKLGKITLEGRVVVPHHDPSLEVSIAYFSGDEDDEHKIGTMVNEMKKLGYDIAPARVLDEVVRENPSLSKTTPWIMSLEEEADVDDTRATEKKITVTTEGEGETITESSPEHAAYPTYNPTGKRGRFEANKGVTYGEYGYVFIKKLPQSTAAPYESGIAQK